MLEKAERFELLGHLYRLIVPMYEKGRNYESLANCYSHLAQACNKIVEVTRTGKRLLGRFYRVAFFGMVSSSADSTYFSNPKIQYIYIYQIYDLEIHKITKLTHILLYYYLGILRGGEWPRIHL